MDVPVGIRHHLVLVGGGHSHVEVLRDWAREPVPAARLTVLVDRPTAVYSGMVPGFVAGQYRLDEIEVDVRGLAQRAGAAWVGARATRLDTRERRLHVEEAASVSYDTVSFDVGSTVSGLDLPGVKEHALRTRPIADFVRSVDMLIERARGRPGFRLVVVGAGAGGVELAFAFRARFVREGLRGASILLLEAGPRVLAGYPDSAARRIERNARARGIVVRCGVRVAEAHADRLMLESGETLPCDVFAWVAGAASLPLFDGAGLERDARGFVKVRETLQAVGHDEIFATGDCASLVTAPDLAKAGVYAVREGPVLARNLRARLTGRPLVPYHPQRDFLSLLNLGDGRAVASKWGLSAEGAWAWRLKDRIDRRFIGRYR
jgi:pyridine nucleotide-disulfide oxidoreductase family protein